MNIDYTDILQFWFDELTEEDQFTGGRKIDDLITNRFRAVHQAATANELAHWRETAVGSLAEVIVLDQFSRNIYRGHALAFASDAQALTLSQVAISKGFEAELTQGQQLFLYMPFMHSESKAIHKIAVELFTELGLPSTLEYEHKHKAIIDQFGRYPHRNSQLGRVSTPEEISYLESNQEHFFKS